MPDRPVCAGCNREFVPTVTGVALDVRADAGTRAAYKVYAEAMKCPGCGIQIFSSFGDRFHVTSDVYDLVKATVTVHI